MIQSFFMGVVSLSLLLLGERPADTVDPVSTRSLTYQESRGIVPHETETLPAFGTGVHRHRFASARIFRLTRVEHLLLSATYVTAMAASPLESASPAFKSEGSRLAQTQGARRRRAEERCLSDPVFPRSLRAVPVARPGGREGPGRGDSPQGGPRGEHEPARSRPALPRGPQRGLRGPDGPLPEAGLGQAAARGRGARAAGARA